MKFNSRSGSSTPLLFIPNCRTSECENHCSSVILWAGSPYGAKSNVFHVRIVFTASHSQTLSYQDKKVCSSLSGKVGKADAAAVVNIPGTVNVPQENVADNPKSYTKTEVSFIPKKVIKSQPYHRAQPTRSRPPQRGKYQSRWRRGRG